MQYLLPTTALESERVHWQIEHFAGTPSKSSYGDRPLPRKTSYQIEADYNRQ